MASNKIDAVVATPRTGTFNKNHARRVRTQGLIPAVVYGAGIESVAVTVDPKVITKILYSDSGHNTIFDLTIEGKGGGKVMIVDWQNEPIKGKLLHIDLKRIAMDKAESSARCCTRLRSSACPRTFPATSTSTSPVWMSTAQYTSPICRTQTS